MSAGSLRDALRQFGWECGPEFERRYHSDPWVFNLANAVEALTARLDTAHTALQEAIDWMDEPWAEPDSMTLVTRWRRLLRAATADPTPEPETDT